MTLNATLASIRERADAGLFQTHPHFIQLGGDKAYWPDPHIYDITDKDPWAQRYDHPKD